MLGCGIFGRTSWYFSGGARSLDDRPRDWVRPTGAATSSRSDRRGFLACLCGPIDETRPSLLLVSSFWGESVSGRGRVALGVVGAEQESQLQWLRRWRRRWQVRLARLLTANAFPQRSVSDRRGAWESGGL